MFGVNNQSARAVAGASASTSAAINAYFLNIAVLLNSIMVRPPFADEPPTGQWLCKRHTRTRSETAGPKDPPYGNVQFRRPGPFGPGVQFRVPGPFGPGVQ